MKQILFTHLHHLDLDWKPGPGQKYRDAPKARCKVTRMTSLAVYYSYASEPTNHGAFYMSREEWDRDYAPATEREATE